MTAPIWLYSIVHAQETLIDTLELPPVTVESNEIGRTALNRVSASASRDPLPWLETAASVSTFDSHSFQTQAAERLESVIDYSAGLLAGVDAAGLNTAIFARGYDSAGSPYLNGHRDIELFYTRDLHTVERVEILKGHASVLYGQGAPGATLQYHSKKPGPDTRHRLTATLGNRQFLRMTADFKGAIDPQHNVQYRVLGAWQESDTFIQRVSNDRWLFAPSLQWHYSDHGRLLLELAYDVNKRPFYFSTLRTHGQFRYDASYVDRRARSRRIYQRSTAYLDHRLSDSWQLHGVLQYARVERQDLLFGFFNKIDEDTLKGYYRDIDDDYDQLNSQLELRGTTHGRAIRQDWLFGVEHNQAEEDLISQRSWEFTLNALNPVFPDAIPPTVPLNRHVIQSHQHLYATQRIHWGVWVANVGLRFSDFTVKSDYGDGLQTTSDETAVSLSGSVLYQWHESTAVYASYSESFQPNRGRDKHNRFFEPRETRQIEMGIKTSLMDAIDIQLALYQLEQTNITTQDPSDPEFETLAGKRRTRGLEFEAAGQWTERLGFKFSYSLLSARYTKNHDGLAGNRPASIPVHHGAVQLVWRPAFTPGFKVFGGLIAVDKRWGDDDNRFRLPGYVRLDMSVQHQWKNTRFRLAVNNVLDKRYIRAAFGDSDVYQGDRRTLKGTMTYRF